MISLAIGGLPAVGKSTLVRKFFKEHHGWQNFKFGLVQGHHNKDINLMIVGKYGQNKVFEGTDLLSMAVHNDFKKLIQKQYKYNILFEGDRLFTSSILEYLDQWSSLNTIIIKSSHTEQRHIDREDNQSERFIKSRNTKINNICKLKFKRKITFLNNDNQEELEKNFQAIKKIVNVI